MRGYGQIAICCEHGSEGFGPVAGFSAHGNEGKGAVAVSSEHCNDDLASIKRGMFLDPSSVLNKHCLTWF